jgi:hypothetical protein
MKTCKICGEKIGTNWSKTIGSEDYCHKCDYELLNSKKVIAKLKKQKFEVCFKRSMKGLKGTLNTVEHEVPVSKQVTGKLRHWNLKKMYAWEKELGSHAHADLEHNW